MEDRPFTPTTTGALASALPVDGALYGAEAREGIVVRWARALASPAALLLLCALSVAFFWKSVLLHQILLPANILYAKDPLWATPIPHPPSANPLDSDALTEFYPWVALASNALHHGTLPLWNPFAFAGTPFLGAMQTAVLYPINIILELLLPPVDVLGARAAIHLAITLTGTFLFARQLALSRPASLLAALSFGLGLPYVVWLEHPMSGALAWLPWLLLCSDYIVLSRRRLWPAVACAAVMALEALSGHGESTAHVLLLCAAYTVFRTLTLWRRRRDSPWALTLAYAPLAVAGAFALGLALAAAHLAPALAQIPRSEAAADRALSAPPLGLAAWGDPDQWKTLVVAVLPDFFGNPTWHVSTLPLTLGYNEIALYVGTIPLFLAVLALARRRAAPVVFFGLAALVALGMAARLPGFALLDDVPGLRLASNGRLRMEYALCVAILAGYGLDSLAVTARGRLTWRLALLWALGLAACAALGGALLLAARPAGQIVPPETAVRVAIPVAWATALIGLLWLHRRAVLSLPALRAGALILGAADLFLQGVGYHATVPRESVAATPPAVRAVQRDHSLYRVAGLGAALWPSLSSLYGLQDVRGYDPAYDAAYERYFASAFGAGGMRLGLADAGPSPASTRALDLMNVKYIFASCHVRLNMRYYRRIFQQDDGCVYRNLTVMPRAMIVHDVAWATPRRAAALLDSGAVDPRSTVLLDPATPLPSQLPHGTAVKGGMDHDAARVTRYGLNRVAVTVHSAARGVLVLSDAYAQGWSARVDGQPAPLARADAVFRAVAFPPGTHRISFTYDPPAFAQGIVVSAIALVIWLLLAARALCARLPRWVRPRL